jgi:hypothetical protein
MRYETPRMSQPTIKAWPLALRTTCEAIEYVADAYRVHELTVFGAPVLTVRLHIKRCVPETQEERSARYAAAVARYARTMLNARRSQCTKSGTRATKQPREVVPDANGVSEAQKHPTKLDRIGLHGRNVRYVTALWRLPRYFATVVTLAAA